MNLKEFMDYRSNCPACNEPLITSFHSHQKRQSFRYEDDRLVVIFPLNSIKKHHLDYDVGYSFSLTNNTWCAEFYKNNVRFEKDTPEFLRARFKELDKNLGFHRFYKSCTDLNCRSYNYSSNDFVLNLKTGDIITRNNELIIASEYIGMVERVDMPGNADLKTYKVYKLLNDYALSRSKLLYGHYPMSEVSMPEWGMTAVRGPYSNLEYLDTALIKISNKEDLTERLNKLIIFS